METIAENRTNIMVVPYASRWGYAAGIFNHAISFNATEKFADIPDKSLQLSHPNS